MADTDQVLNLAAIIRKVDGNHNKGAAALAESILDHPNFRDVLARWGNPTPQPPADGEVAELVAWLQEEADDYECIGCEDSATKCNRAADLLERLSPPQPVPVSERLPGDQLCWWFEADEDCGYGSTWTLLRIRGTTTDRTHWLPAHALPLPEVGE